MFNKYFIETFYKVKQFYQSMFPDVRKINYKKVDEYLDEDEKKLFNTMLDYEKQHSYNLLLDLEKETRFKNKKLYCKLALIHDIGKGKNISTMERVWHSLFDNIKVLKEHPEKGYELLKEKNKKLAILIKNHHNKSGNSADMMIFQELDNKN